MMANRPSLLRQINVYIWAGKCFSTSLGFLFFPSYIYQKNFGSASCLFRGRKKKGRGETIERDNKMPNNSLNKNNPEDPEQTL